MTDQPEIGEVWECICRGKPELHTIDGSMSYETGVSCRSTSERPVGLDGPPTPATFLRAFPDADAVTQDMYGVTLWKLNGDSLVYAMTDAVRVRGEFVGRIGRAYHRIVSIPGFQPSLDWGPRRTEASKRIYIRPEKRGGE